MRYDLEVLRDNKIVAAERFVLTDSRDLWSRIAGMAKRVDEPGCQIRVTEEAGGIAILIGVAAARRSLAPPAPRLPILKAADAPSGRAPAVVPRVRLDRLAQTPAMRTSPSSGSMSGGG